MKRNIEKPYITADPLNYRLLKEKAMYNKNNMTDAERFLWDHLAGNSLGVRFRRQQIIDNYIVDFVCLSKQLVIEVDGGYHFEEKQQEMDEIRTKHLRELGFDELRFTNEEIFSNIDIVLQTIQEYL